MRIGVIASSGGVHEALDLARTAEQNGWDGFFTWDGMSVGSAAAADPFSLLAAAAQHTRSITLGAMVFAPARRRPLVFAQQVLTVDHLSAGRLVVPVGLGAADDAGFSRVTGEAVSARERAALLDESLHVLDLASSGEPFSFVGEHHRFSDVALALGSVQRPRVPVWAVGAWPSERSMARAARWDGVVLQLLRSGEEPTASQVTEAVTWIGAERERLREGGVRLGDRFEVVVSGRLPDDPAAASERVESLSAAGATWWVEARWDPTETAETLSERVRRGPLPG
ncbi:LLM class flavin-dependent oxidoreductase [Actinotalea sp.]|uniref:LLM class flavin-dependent oxidoreductase n=1 Tax=Actinotalea sp. TaxID=1872145 RepID=UPI003568C2CB